MVAIIDYRMGNTRSVAKTLKAMGYDTVLTNDHQQLRDADHLILPGVGAFADGMKNLRELGLIEILNEEVVRKGKPFLAICIGLQLLADEGMEHGGPHAGLGWIHGRVERFHVDESQYKVPHMGWNNVTLRGDPELFRNVPMPDPDFYFVHSFHLKAKNPDDVIATCDYGETFVAAVQKNNIMGTQFHPEKSQKKWCAGTQKLFEFVVTMLKKRIIPCLLLEDLKLIKTIQFGQHRNIGSYIAAVTVFNARDVDELVFLDISASDEKRDPLYPLISDVARECFMPLAVGGGVRTMEHVERLLRVGADKVVINTIALDNPEFITQAAKKYGAQLVVVSLDAKKTGNGYEVFRNHGTQATGKTPVEWAQEVEKRGAGEIFLTSIDRDGMMQGYDIELTESVAKAVNIPVIACGGAGKPDDCVEVIQRGYADAVAAASIFQYTQYTPLDIKQALSQHGIPARI